MKKVFVLFLVLALSLSLVGCLGVSEDEGIGKVVTDYENLSREDGEDLSSELIVEMGDEEARFGEVVDLKAGIYDLLIMDGSYGVLLEDELIVNRGITNRITIEDEELILAQNTITFTFDPDEYEEYEEGMDVAIFGDPLGYEDWDDAFGNEDYLLTKDNGEYTIELEATAGDKYEFSVTEDWSAVSDWGEEGRVVPQDTEETEEDDFENEQGVVTFPRVVQ